MTYVRSMMEPTLAADRHAHGEARPEVVDDRIALVASFVAPRRGQGVLT